MTTFPIGDVLIASIVGQKSRPSDRTFLHLKLLGISQTVLPLEVYNHQPFTTCASHKTSHTPRLIRQTIPTRNNTFVSNSTTSSTKATPQYSLLVPFNPKVPGSRPERPSNIKVGSSDSSLRIGRHLLSHDFSPTHLAPFHLHNGRSFANYEATDSC